MSMVLRLQMNENQECQSQVHVTARWYLIFKPGKRGLNSWLRPVLLGGGPGSHTLPDHMTGNGRSTRHSRRVITLSPGALLEIFKFFHTVAVRLKNNGTSLFFDWGRRYSQVQLPAIQLVCYKAVHERRVGD